MTSTRRPLHYMREWRLARGMSQEDLAKAVGTGKSKGIFSRYETGETGMTLDLLLRVMRALNTTPNEFFLPPPQTRDTPRRLRERQQFWRMRQSD